LAEIDVQIWKCQFPERQSVEMKKTPLPALSIRFSAFLILWLVLDGVNLGGLLIGLPAAALAAWISIHLLSPSPGRPRLIALLSMGWHFLWSSVMAGVDVAIRAFHPQLPLRAGFVTCECGIPAGSRRDLFLAMGSLMPGSLPVAEDGDGRIVLHCLDTGQPQAEQMADHEARLVRALGGSAADA
jgi:multicomponent Na+:H+ antiporter subunit E